MVGDSVYDIQPATRAGVVAIGLLSGGAGAAELTDAGAIAVYEDACALLDALDDVLGGGSADAPPAVGRAA
ncbi:hypothetical protein DDQ50_06980 [Amnibacterium flavum]|uniref:Haloacid dehalogenase n=2 Tax=Amnibacterium flavum TaxID=2173173 RepID=A0A2V1HU74_9MICO|nr:hypothetical protein DDQ50_06980 [Amnibacterium flavum]